MPTLGVKPGFSRPSLNSGIAVDLSDGGEGSHATALALEPDVAIFDKAFVEPKIYTFLHHKQILPRSLFGRGQCSVVFNQTTYFSSSMIFAAISRFFAITFVGV